MNDKSYTELMKLNSYEERLDYLMINGNVGKDTFAHDRYLNQNFYKSKQWRSFRNSIIIRDNACDLASPERELRPWTDKTGKIHKPSLYIHHINPITIDDLLNNSSKILDPDNAITVSLETHNAIHYGNKSTVSRTVERKPNDTCPWK